MVYLQANKLKLESPRLDTDKLAEIGFKWNYLK